MNLKTYEELSSWVDVPQNSDFTIQNLPYGIFEHNGQEPRVGVAIGEQVLDLSFLYEQGYLGSLNIESNVFKSETLNAFIALGKKYWGDVRTRLIEILSSDNSELKENTEHVKAALISLSDAKMLMPVHVHNYTDFYSSVEHATNVGKMFRPDGEPLLPNWKHIPVGYHGRASSIVISGTPIKRPKGQTKPDDATNPVFGPCKLLDFELEMGFIVGKENEMGQPVSTEAADDHIFGMVIFNDWSARDIQKWEYVPLGPFLSKNFASSISPWIVTLEALSYFKSQGPKQEPEVLPYLKYEGEKNYDIQLEVYLQPKGGEAQQICESNYKYMYWNMAQQLAHHTISGCNMQVGDICASGTISGPDEGSYGSMLELSWKGTKPIQMQDGSERKFIQDGDTIIMKAFCVKNGIRIGFGEVSGTILPAD